MSRHNREPRKQRAAAKHNYSDALLAAAQQAFANGTIKPGQVYEIPVRHDSWCDLPKAAGPCNCNPVIRPPERVPAPEEN
jgi:hypothetical protein